MKKPPRHRLNDCYYKDGQVTMTPPDARDKLSIFSTNTVLLRSFVPHKNVGGVRRDCFGRSYLPPSQ
jgi:hypothetical protein